MSFYHLNVADTMANLSDAGTGGIVENALAHDDKLPVGGKVLNHFIIHRSRWQSGGSTSCFRYNGFPTCGIGIARISRIGIEQHRQCTVFRCRGDGWRESSGRSHVLDLEEYVTVGVLAIVDNELRFVVVIAVYVIVIEDVKQGELHLQLLARCGRHKGGYLVAYFHSIAAYYRWEVRGFRRSVCELPCAEYGVGVLIANGSDSVEHLCRRSGIGEVRIRGLIGERDTLDTDVDSIVGGCLVVDIHGYEEMVFPFCESRYGCGQDGAGEVVACEVGFAG